MRKKLEIAVKALKFYAVGNHYEYDSDIFKKYGVYLGKSVVDVSKLFTVKSFDEKQYRKDMFGEEDD